MLAFHTKDFGKITCHLKTAEKFPVLKRILQNEDHQNCIRVSCIKGVALQTLLACAERPSDLEHCSHNAKQLAILPSKGRTIRCTDETLKEIRRTNMLELEADLEWRKVEGSSETDDAHDDDEGHNGSLGRYFVHLNLRDDAVIDEQPSCPSDWEQLGKSYRPLSIYCISDGGTVKCQLATAKKCLKWSANFENLDTEVATCTTACWSPAIQMHLDSVSSKALWALMRCAERPEDYEPCSHNARLRSSLTKTACVHQANLDEIIENNQFGLEGKLRFTVALEKDVYYMSMRLKNEVHAESTSECRYLLQDLMHRLRLRTYKWACSDGVVEFLLKTTEKCPVLADYVHGEGHARKPDLCPVKGITAEVLTLFFELAVRREDFGMAFRSEPLLGVLVPVNGQSRLISSKNLVDLTREKILFINCKLSCTPSNVQGFYNARLFWQWEPGYLEASRLHFAVNLMPVQTLPQIACCIVECAHGDLVELPCKYLHRFPAVQTLWKSDKRLPLKLSHVSSLALKALIHCAMNVSQKIKIHAVTFYEIFDLPDKGFQIPGKLKFQQDREFNFFQISIDWLSETKRQQLAKGLHRESVSGSSA